MWWAPCRRLPGRGVPRRACVAAACWGRGWGGARVTRGLCPVIGWWVGGGGAACSVFPVGPPGPVPGWPACGASLLLRAVMSGGRLAGMLACCMFRWPVTPLGSPLGVVPGRLDPPLAAALLSAAEAPLLLPWSTPWAPGVAAGRAVRARGCVVFFWRRRLGLAIWHGCRPGLASHLACQCPRAAVPLRRGGPCCQCPALWMQDACPELVAWRVRPRGVSRDSGVRRVRVRVRAGCRVTARWCLRGPYCRSGWWIVA